MQTHSENTAKATSQEQWVPINFQTTFISLSGLLWREQGLNVSGLMFVQSENESDFFLKEHVSDD